MKTVRRPPYPKWNPGYFPCSSLTPLPLSSRRPSVSFGGFGLRLIILSIVGLLLAVSGPHGVAEAAAFIVTKTADTNDGACDADCSLREAVVAANAAPGADTITVPAGTYILTLFALGIFDDVTITGAGSAATIIDGNAQDRVIDLASFVVNTVDISGVTLRNGRAQGFGVRRRPSRQYLSHTEPNGRGRNREPRHRLRRRDIRQ